MNTARMHAFSDDVLANYDATGLAALVRSGQLSALEVTQAAIDRAQRVNAVLNGIAFSAFDDALLQARTPPSTCVFCGVPTFIKDNTDVKGLPTMQGSRAVKPVPAARHGAFATQFLAQGFTVLGKSALPEFGFNASTEFADAPPTRNPWNPEFSCGASSGGAAVLVASGVVPVAHANDGGGSIRIPAACCGLVGLKPTRGRFIDSEQARSLPVNIVGEGIVSRSVRDQATFVAGMEQTWRNAALPAVGLVEGPGKRRLRIGLLLDSITGTPSCAETRAVVEHTARILEQSGHVVEPMPMPVPLSFLDDFSTYWGMLSFMLERFGRSLLGPDFDAARMDAFSHGLAAYYRKRWLRTPGMLWRLKRSARQYAQAIAPYDAILTPVLAHTVPRLGHLSPHVPFDTLFARLLRYVAFTPLNNATGTPAISVPMGSCANGLPIGVQLQATHGAERTLLELAFELEAAQPFRQINTAQES